jgi:glycosyltransferase involved in cell wall biosynthesis
MIENKKILIVSCVSPPETVVAGRVNYDICEYLSTKGNNITLITPFPSRPIGKFGDNDKKKEEIIQVNEKFEHIRINSFQSPQYNFLKRFYESFSFGYKATKYININYANVDLIYATPWPFIGQLMFVLFRKSKNVPLIMNVQDLYPESFFAKYNSRLLNILFKPFVFIDKSIALKSTHLSVVSESMKNDYVKSRGVDTNKITVVENWQDEEEFLKRDFTRKQIITKYNLECLADKFIFMYLGNIGPVAGLENVIREFAKMKESNACIVIAGSGTSKISCMKLVNSLALSNVYFLDIPTGLNSVVELQSIADVLLLPMHPDASSSSIPSKLIAYMFSSKPVLTSAKSDSTTGLAITENNCGLLVNTDNTWFNQMSKMIHMDTKELKEMGKNAFKYGFKRYSKKNGLLKIEKLFNQFTKEK